MYNELDITVRKKTIVIIIIFKQIQTDRKCITKRFWKYVLLKLNDLQELFTRPYILGQHKIN